MFLMNAVQANKRNEKSYIIHIDCNLSLKTKSRNNHCCIISFEKNDAIFCLTNSAPYS